MPTFRMYRCRWARTTLGAGWAARWCTTRGIRPDSTRATSLPDKRRRWCRLADQLRGLAAVLRGHRAGTARRGRGLALGRPAHLPATPSSGRRQRRDLPARRVCVRHHGEGGTVAISNGRFGNRPHCIYRGNRRQGCKSTPRHPR